MTLASSLLKYLTCFLLVFSSTWVLAGNESTDETSKPGIELQVLDNLLQTSADNMLFIDVRDPVEIMFTGFTDAVDANIPFLLVNRAQWDDKKGVFMMNQNPDFANQVAALLKKKGLARDATIVTMCRSGSARGKPSAEYLREQGFPGARYLIHGFQGPTSKEGDNKGMRISQGWQNSGMPWQSKPNPLKIYRE